MKRPPASRVSEPASPRRTWWLWLVLGVALPVASLGGWYAWSQSQRTAALDAAPLATPLARPPVDLESIATTSFAWDRVPSRSEAGYVGSQVCAECHAGIAESFAQTNHSRACRFPQPEEMPEGFEPGQGKLTPSFPPGLTFEMKKAGDDYVQQTTRATPAGTQQHTARIDLIYGAGGSADDVFLSWRDDGFLVELPMVWLYSMNCWGASHFDPNSSGDYSRALTVRCLECHNTWVHHVPGTPNQYRREDALISISCESCHGPGHAHVTHHRAHPGETTGQSIVQPASLSRERELEVCLQCHSNAINRRTAAFAYRPGLPLDDFYRTLTVEHNEDDHVANQITYLRQSKCFQESERLTCITCHDPHQPQGPTNAGSASCAKCHQPAECGDHENLPTAVRDDCVGCHMRSYVKINVNFQTEDDNFVVPFRRVDHRIAVHEIAKQEVLLKHHREHPSADAAGEIPRLTQALTQHWFAEAERFRGEHRYLAQIAALREALAVESTPEVKARLAAAVQTQAKLDEDWARATVLMAQNRPADAIPVLTEILERRPDDAKAHGKLGTQYAKAGQRELADRHLRAVTEHDPDDSYGLAMLGWLAYLDRDYARALEYYQAAEIIEPYETKIQYHYGLALLEANRLDEAAQKFERSLVIDPANLAPLEGLIVVRRRQGKLAEAIALCRRAVERTQEQNLDVLMTMAMTYAEAGHYELALGAAEKARVAALVTGSPQLPQVDRAIATIQAFASQMGAVREE